MNIMSSDSSDSISPMYAVFIAIFIWIYLFIRMIFGDNEKKYTNIPGYTSDIIQLSNLIDIDCKNKLGLIEEDFLPDIDINNSKPDWTLLDKKGSLNIDCVGITTKAAHNCMLSGPWYRQKRWNRWFVNNNNGIFSVSILDLNYGYAASIFVYLKSTGKTYHLNESHLSFVDHTMHLSDHVNGSSLLKSNNISISFSSKQNNCLKIKVTVIDMCSNGPLEAQLTVLFTNSSSQSQSVQGLHTVIPTTKYIFHYLARYSSLLAAGIVRIGGNTVLDFQPTNKLPSFATLDFVRGIFPRNIAKVSASASGYAYNFTNNETLTLSLNLCDSCSKFPNENCIIVNGELFKISRNLKFNSMKSQGSLIFRIENIIPCPISSSKTWLSTSKPPTFTRAVTSPIESASINSSDRGSNISKFLKKNSLPYSEPAKKLTLPAGNGLGPTLRRKSSELSPKSIAEDLLKSKEADKKLTFDALKKSAAFVRVSKLISDVDLTFTIKDELIDGFSFGFSNLQDKFYFGTFSGFIQIGIRKVEIKDLFGWISSQSASW